MSAPIAVKDSPNCAITSIIYLFIVVPKNLLPNVRNAVKHLMTKVTLAVI